MPISIGGMNASFHESFKWILLVPSFLYMLCLLYSLFAILLRKKEEFSSSKDDSPLMDYHVSLIIPVRNEEKTLSVLIESIEHQDYESMEVICVDDHSTDASLQILKAWEERSSKKVRVFSLPSHREGKKQALAYGIERAHGEIILTTDADTWHSPRWIRTLVTYMDREGVDVFLGPVRYLMISPKQHLSHFLLCYQQFENALLMVMTAILVDFNYPFLANGANFAFRKNLYYQVKGYEGIHHYASGDDMGLLSKFVSGNVRKIFFSWDRNAIVNTYPVRTWKEWFQQRIRWVSKMRFYSLPQQLGSWFFFPIHHVVMLLFCAEEPVIGISLLLWKAILEGILVAISYRRIYWKRPHFSYFLFFLFTYSWLVSVGICLGYLFRKYEWKGRVVT